MSELILTGPMIYTEQGLVHHHSLSIKNGLISGIEKKIVNKNAQIRQFPENYRIVPGFIDLHIHGANNHDVMDGTQTSLQSISQALLAEGVTGFLATTMTAPVNELTHVMQTVQTFSQQPTNLLGLHLEGPFISAAKAGAQQSTHILSPDITLFAEWQKISGDLIKLVTLAPELKNVLPFIAYLRQQNIIASLGHSHATYAETLAAFDQGANYMTHLFNAMRALHHREPGILTAALLNDQVWTELIVDGIHLHPAIVALALKLKSKDKIILVTDAMRAKCLGDGKYTLGGQMVEVKNNQATIANGRLAGSVLRMPEAIKNMMNFTNVDLSDVIQMVSANPAKVLGIYDKKGSIAVGKDADLVILNERLAVELTILQGNALKP